jgi:crotonobetainyl-CoA:carnitine CoA-transferase CaiB-like acyl-CoA transferase
MKSEAELMTWSRKNAYFVDVGGGSHLVVSVKNLREQLFAGKKLVDVGAVVLSVEDAEALDSLLTKFRVGYLLAHGFDEHNKLRIAIEQEKTK